MGHYLRRLPILSTADALLPPTDLVGSQAQICPAFGRSIGRYRSGRSPHDVRDRTSVPQDGSDRTAGISSSSASPRRHMAREPRVERTYRNLAIGRDFMPDDPDPLSRSKSDSAAIRSPQTLANPSIEGRSRLASETHRAEFSDRSSQRSGRFDQRPLADAGSDQARQTSRVPFKAWTADSFDVTIGGHKWAPSLHCAWRLWTLLAGLMIGSAPRAFGHHRDRTQPDGAPPLQSATAVGLFASTLSTGP